ncbi:MAG TPA: hypothetical protein VIS10_15945, partial [Anaerolineales bacterium]
MMHSAFLYNQYFLKRQVLALTGKIRLYSPDGSLLLYSQQKMFRLREDIRVYNDESRSQELLYIQARNIIDFSAAYDVIDSLSGIKVGVLRRKGLRSLLRDQWEILDASDQPQAILQEDNPTRALLRRLLLGTLLPQNYDVISGETRLADFRQRFNLFRYELELDFSMDSARRLDRRVGLAAAILLGIIEGRQES